jgi:hypothetical protein
MEFDFQRSIYGPRLWLLAVCLIVGCNQYKKHVAEVESAVHEAEVATQATRSWQPEVPTEIAADSEAAKDYVAIKKGEQLLLLMRQQSSIRSFLLHCKSVGSELSQLADTAGTAAVGDALRAFGEALRSHGEELESAMIMAGATNSGEASSSGVISSAIGAGIEGYFIGESARQRYQGASEQAALAVKEYNDRYSAAFPLLSLVDASAPAYEADVVMGPGDRWELYEASDSAGSKWDGSVLEIQVAFPAERIETESGSSDEQIRLTGLIRWYKNGEFRGIENFEGTYQLQKRELRILGQTTSGAANLVRGIYTAKLSPTTGELYGGQWASSVENDTSIIPGVFSARPLK